MRIVLMSVTPISHSTALPPAPPVFASADVPRTPVAPAVEPFDGLELVRTADNALGEIHALLHEVRMLAMRSLSGSIRPSERATLQAEADRLVEQLADRIGTAAYHGRALLNGGEVVLEAGPPALSVVLPDLRPVVDETAVRLDGTAVALGRAQAAVELVARDREELAALRRHLEPPLAA